MNYFLPLAYIAIRKRNFQCLFTLLTLLLVFEQGKANLYKWLRPICCYRSKISQLKAEWEAEGYDLDENIPTKREKIYHQVKLNDAMMDNENDVSVEQMNFIMQFGYISLFSTVFPLGAAVCLLSNTILLKAVKNDFEYVKRFMPEISMGIGQFMYMLDLISYASVIINSAIIYFTSHTYRKLFVYNPTDDSVLCFDGDRVYCASVGSYFKLFSGPAGFLVFVIAIEHLILIAKVFISKVFAPGVHDFDHENRLNAILRSTHEAAQAVRLQERIDKGDESAEEAINKFAKIGHAGAERLQAIDEGLGKEDLAELKENAKAPKINYAYNHYGIKPIYSAKHVQLKNYKIDQHMGVDLFPENKDEIEDVRNKQAVQVVKLIERSNEFVAKCSKEEV